MEALATFLVPWDPGELVVSESPEIHVQVVGAARSARGSARARIERKQEGEGMWSMSSQ